MFMVTKQIPRRILISISVAFLPELLLADEPSWIHLPSRIVDNGYIVYVGSGEDSTLERARFRAKSMAVQVLTNECTFPHKETRIEDFYDERAGEQYRSYAKVAIQYTDCDEAKQALTPEVIKRLASQPLIEEQKQYREMLFGDPDRNKKQIAQLEKNIQALSDSIEDLKNRHELASEKEQAALAPAGNSENIILVLLPKTIRLRRSELKSHSLAGWQRRLATRGLRKAYRFRSTFPRIVHAPKFPKVRKYSSSRYPKYSYAPHRFRFRNGRVRRVRWP